MKGRICVTAVPAGEAPQWVREKWVGVELPLALRSAHDFRTFGVLSGPRSLDFTPWRSATTAVFTGCPGRIASLKNIQA